VPAPRLAIRDTSPTTILGEHPIVIAHQLAQRFGRENDDVLVLVAR
jgi:hypothetical protein